MKAAIIDVGSNSIRLLLGTYIDGQWHNEPKRLWTALVRYAIDHLYKFLSLIHI